MSEKPPAAEAAPTPVEAVIIGAGPVGLFQIFELGLLGISTHIIDSHNGRVIDEVWRLFEHSLALSGGRSTLLEWDEDIPGFEELHAEALRARAWLERARGKSRRVRVGN